MVANFVVPFAEGDVSQDADPPPGYFVKTTPWPNGTWPRLFFVYSAG